ncbi:MAG: hypothetical protein BWX87_01756 [Bacteroidetes bacterium ADurb.Bin123]|nr:MAG: hypothetical protein BWX87_01756 [Bacteroidetes bacterium ADurb.Bin123]
MDYLKATIYNNHNQTNNLYNWFHLIHKLMHFRVKILYYEPIQFDLY